MFFVFFLFGSVLNVSKRDLYTYIYFTSYLCIPIRFLHIMFISESMPTRNRDGFKLQICKEWIITIAYLKIIKTMRLA